MKKIILGFVGEIASGKGTASEYIKSKYGANVYRFSTMLRDILNRIYVETTRENLQDLSTLLRGKFGQDVMARVIARDVENDNGEIVVVDGIRRFADIKYLKEINGFNLICVSADSKIRYERITKRDENLDDSKKTYEEFLKEAENECELEIKDISKEASLEIDNNGSVEDFYKNIDEVIKNILNS